MITKDRIVDIGLDNVQACCQFFYKGMLISFSRIHNEDQIAVIDEKDNHNILSANFKTVEEAIQFVDTLKKKDPIEVEATCICGSNEHWAITTRPMVGGFLDICCPKDQVNNCF